VSLLRQQDRRAGLAQQHAIPATPAGEPRSVLRVGRIIMTADEIVEQLRPLGTDGYKKVLQKHGVPEPCFGVKIEDLKKFQKRIKKDYRLALELYESGIYDAMYLAGLIADDAQMTKKDLRHWVEKATCSMLSEYTVAWVAAESRHGRELALEWIDSKKENVAACGWATLSGLVAIKDDSELDLAELKQLLQRVQQTIHQQPNRVRYGMNGFVIAVGSYVTALTDAALKTAAQIGQVSVDMGDTACKVPSAAEYIQKVQKRGAIGKKRKTTRC
jgi:3-methyladenine DNA glycosylase AlkD